MYHVQLRKFFITGYVWESSWKCPKDQLWDGKSNMQKSIGFLHRKTKGVVQKSHWPFKVNWLVVCNIWTIFFHSVGNVIIPTDELIFFRGVAQPPTNINIYNVFIPEFPENPFTIWIKSIGSHPKPIPPRMRCVVPRLGPTRLSVDLILLDFEVGFPWFPN